MFPTFKAISLAEIVETAIGVSLTLAMSITPEETIISSNCVDEVANSTDIPFFAATSRAWNPK